MVRELVQHRCRPREQPLPVLEPLVVRPATGLLEDLPQPCHQLRRGGGYVCGFGERTQQVNIGAQATDKTVVGPIAGEWVPTVTDPVTSVPHDVVLMNFRVTDSTAPALTVVGVISGDNLTISGTSQGVPLGSLVDLTITDSSSGSLTTTASTGAGGAYVSSPVAIGALADGELRIVATTSVNENLIVAETVVVKGTSGLTLTGVISGTDLTISGTTAGVNTGQAVNLTITAQNGDSRSGTAIVGLDGSYSTIVNVSGLASGLLTILADTFDSNNVALGATYQLNYDGGAATSCNGVTVSTESYNGNDKEVIELAYDGVGYSPCSLSGRGQNRTATCTVPSSVSVTLGSNVVLRYTVTTRGKGGGTRTENKSIPVNSCSPITGVTLP